VAAYIGPGVAASVCHRRVVNHISFRESSEYSEGSVEVPQRAER
jgi:hypothetical protein